MIYDINCVIVYMANGELRKYDRQKRLLEVELVTFSNEIDENYWVDYLHSEIMKTKGEITDKDIDKAFQILALKNIDYKEEDYYGYAWINFDGTYVKSFYDNKGHIYQV